MGDNNINLNSKKINQDSICKVPVVKQPADSSNQKESSYIKLEPPKKDKLAVSFDNKSTKPDAIQSLPFVEKENDKGIKSVINDVTTFGPVKIDKVTIPATELIPVDIKDKTKNPVPTPGTGIEQAQEKKIAVQIKVEF